MVEASGSRPRAAQPSSSSQASTSAASSQPKGKRPRSPSPSGERQIYDEEEEVPTQELDEVGINLTIMLMMSST